MKNNDQSKSPVLRLITTLTVVDGNGSDSDVDRTVAHTLLHESVPLFICCASRKCLPSPTLLFVIFKVTTDFERSHLELNFTEG